MDKDLLRLSEIMGTLSFLRHLCASADADIFSQSMSALLSSETASSSRREQLAGAYNKGYRAFSLTYRSCTPSAQQAMARLMQEGNTISRRLTLRYGN